MELTGMHLGKVLLTNLKNFTKQQKYFLCKNKLQTNYFIAPF